MIIFTSVCANYVHKARTLAQSVKANIPDAKMILCLCEREIAPNIPADMFDDIVLTKDIWEDNFDRFIFKHSIVEASTSVKGQFFRYVMDQYPDEDKFVYLDPDIYVYDDFVELREELDKHPIVLCPHLLRPGNIKMELSSTAHGVYNLGFLGISRSEKLPNELRGEGRACIDWWADRLSQYCYDDIVHGVFTDQKWFDLVPVFFHPLIFRHHGYDFAPWSLDGAVITEEKGKYFINGDPLRFIHYSSIGPGAEECMDMWMSEDAVLFRSLYTDYMTRHNENNADRISSTPWSYSTYHSGEKIDDSIRQSYREKPYVMLMYNDPFAYSNGFYKNLLHGTPGQLSPVQKAKHLFYRSKTMVQAEGMGAVITKVKNRLQK